MKTNGEQLMGLQCPEIFDNDNFETARNRLIRVRTGKMSASMSGLEYYQKEVDWMLERCQ